MTGFSETPLSELTLRKYESPLNLNQRETLKKICLSLGLLQPGDSRDVIVDILLVLEQSKKKKENLTSIDIKNRLLDIRREFNLSLNGTADSNVRRQIKRLKDLFIVEKKRNTYRIFEFMDLEEIFSQKIKEFLLKTIVKRNEEYFEFYKKFEVQNEN